jgi:hypothetical protein
MCLYAPRSGTEIPLAPGRAGTIMNTILAIHKTDRMLELTVFSSSYLCAADLQEHHTLYDSQCVHWSPTAVGIMFFQNLGKWSTSARPDRFEFVPASSMVSKRL